MRHCKPLEIRLHPRNALMAIAGSVITNYSGAGQRSSTPAAINA
jgi:hypothetical protein